jgi:hypothetical protein
MRTKIIFSLFFFCLFMLSCRSSPRAMKTKPSDTGSVSDNPTVPHLIADYSGMKEDSIIASAWIDADFSLDNCAEVSVQPVLNMSRMDYPYGQQRIEAALRDAIAAKKKNPSGKTILMTAAITAMHGKPGFIKQFSLTYDDMPSIELEVVIAEAQSKRELAKFCHMARAKNTDQALDQLILDVTAFLKKKI